MKKAKKKKKKKKKKKNECECEKQQYKNGKTQGRSQAEARKPGLQNHHIGLDAKTMTLLFAYNKGADQPAHPRSLISAFVIRCLKNRLDIY